jgi:hypothetical protein
MEAEELVCAHVCHQQASTQSDALEACSLNTAGDSEANVDRRERLRKLAMETIDLAKVSRGRIAMF